MLGPIILNIVILINMLIDYIWTQNVTFETEILASTVPVCVVYCPSSCTGETLASLRSEEYKRLFNLL